MSEYGNTDHKAGFNNRKMYIFVMAAAVLLVIFGIVKFVEYLIDEVAMGYLTMGQSVIIFVFEAVAVVLISKVLKRYVEKRIVQVEEQV